MGSEQQVARNQLRGGMVGMGMIFDDTYRPFFEGVQQCALYEPTYGVCDVTLAAVASRTGRRAEAYQKSVAETMPQFASFAGDDAMPRLLDQGVDFVCVATPDDRHFDLALQALQAGKHLLVEKPSVLSLQQLDQLVNTARQREVLAKIVYHKLFDPDHKRMRTMVEDRLLQHVNNGYCVLLEPKMISGSQFSEWITGRNPGTYVAVHYIKLIDFTFGGRLTSVQCRGQRGLVGPREGTTWDSTQLRLNYEYDSGREATFDIHTSWVMPDNFPGYVEQEVQFRFDNGVWNGHSRRRGVECTIEGKTPIDMKISLNNHYSAPFVEPWNARRQSGYGIEAIEQFVREVAFLEFGANATRDGRLAQLNQFTYNELAADRQVVAAIQAMEAILERQAAGQPDCVARVNDSVGGLVLYAPGDPEPAVLYDGKV